MAEDSLEDALRIGVLPAVTLEANNSGIQNCRIAYWEAAIFVNGSATKASFFSSENISRNLLKTVSLPTDNLILIFLYFVLIKIFLIFQELLI